MTDTDAVAVLIERRFCGPDDSGQGGFVCGLLADAVGNPAEVRLCRPPPLDRPLALVPTDDAVELRDGDDVVAVGRPVDDLGIDVPANTVAVAEAEGGAAAYLEWAAGAHPFPRCFCCGPERAAGDGLRVFAGPVPGRPEVFASPWVPDASLVSDASGEVPDAIVWAALDCPTSAPVLPTLPEGKAVVLGTMAADVRKRPRVDEQYVLMSWHAGGTEKVAHGECALIGDNGDVFAVARGTWVYVDHARFGGG